MNKYSLIFLNKDIEKSFQDKFRDLYLKFIIAVALGSMILIIVKFINDLLTSDYSRFSLELITISFLILEIIGAIKWKQLINYGLYTNTILILLYQLTLVTKDAQVAYLFGQNQMGIMCVQLFSMDFRQGMFFNIITFITRLGSAHLIAKNQIDFAQDVYSTYVFLFLSMCIYYKNLYIRTFFLYSLREDIYQNLFPKMNHKPAFLFEYDSESVQFISKISSLKGFLENISNPLLHFLRNSYYQKNNMESYIFREIIQKKQMGPQVQQLQVNFLGQIVEITFSYMFIQTYTFIILVDSECQLVRTIRKNHLDKVRYLKEKVQQLVRVSSKLIDKSIHKNNPEMLLKLKCFYLQMMCNMFKSRLHQEQIDLVQLMKSIRQFFKITRRRIVINCKKQIKIKAIKQYLYMFFLELFSQENNQHQKYFVVDVFQGQVIVIISGMEQLPKSNLFQLISKRLLLKQVSHNQVHTLYFSDETYVSFLAQDLN